MTLVRRLKLNFMRMKILFLQEGENVFVGFCFDKENSLAFHIIFLSGFIKHYALSLQKFCCDDLL